MKIPDFKISVSFSGDNRKKFVEPICEELIKCGFKKEDIFYDNWYMPLINGPDSDETIRKIYGKCQLNIVFLSKTYKDKIWTGNIEWPTIKTNINNGNGEKIFLLGISIEANILDEIAGLSSARSIYWDITDESPENVAKVILERYNLMYPKIPKRIEGIEGSIVSIVTIPNKKEFYDMSVTNQLFLLKSIETAYNGPGVTDRYNTMFKILDWLNSLDEDELDYRVIEKIRETDLSVGWEYYQHLDEVERGK